MSGWLQECEQICKTLITRLVVILDPALDSRQRNSMSSCKSPKSTLSQKVKIQIRGDKSTHSTKNGVNGRGANRAKSLHKAQKCKMLQHRTVYIVDKIIKKEIRSAGYSPLCVSLMSLSSLVFLVRSDFVVISLSSGCSAPFCASVHFSTKCSDVCIPAPVFYAHLRMRGIFWL